MPKPSEYKHIHAWGKMLRSFEYYIQNEQSIAARDNAPVDAVYRKSEPGKTEYKWVSVTECSPVTQKNIKAYL